jgi:exodeoxyribonuclease-3
MKIRIATWNMAYWQYKKYFEETWDYYLKEIDADIIFFQEAKPSKVIEDDKDHLVWNEIGGGAFSIANTNIENRKLTFISLYGLMESNGPTKGYSITNLHRMLSDLTCIFNGHLDGKRNIVLGGDLNASVQLDPTQKNDSHKIFFDRLEDFNLNDCFKLSNKEFPVQTLRHHRSKVKWQNDYFFISKSLSKKLINCEVVDNDKVRKYSDHNPVVITLDL